MKRTRNRYKRSEAVRRNKYSHVRNGSAIDVAEIAEGKQA